MATLRTYRCDCGYEVQTEPTGHYGLFAGEFLQLSLRQVQRNNFYLG